MAIPVQWRTKKARYSLQGDVCPECARAIFPPRRRCPYCGREAVEPVGAESETHYEFAFVLPQGVGLQVGGDD